MIHKIHHILGASGCVMVSKLDLETCKSKFKFHRVPHSSGLVQHLSKKLSKLQHHIFKYPDDSFIQKANRLTLANNSIINKITV